MSIATDEALEWHGLHGDENGDRDSSYSADEMDDAYVAGRTAYPTEAEIEAAAGKLAEIMNSVNLGIEKYSGITVIQTAMELLTAARKAVTE